MPPSPRPSSKTHRHALPPEIQRRIDRLAADRVHGAAALTRTAARIGIRLASTVGALPIRQRAALLRRAGEALSAAARPIAGVQAVASLLRASSARPRSGRWLRHQCAGLLRAETDAAGRLGRELGRRLGPGAAPIVTMSRSSSVLRALSGLPAARRPREVRVLLSRPGGEGREMAEDLGRRGLRPRLLPDGRAASALDGSRAVVVGADAVLPDGTLIHKVGTRRLAQLARRHAVPLYVLATPAKFVPRGRSVRVPRQGLFDRTPGALFVLVAPSRPPWSRRRRAS